MNPADIPKMDKQNYQKTDAIDCRNLAKQLEAKQLKGIYIPSEEQDLLISLVRQRASITKQLRTSKNQIKALLLYHGVEIPKQFDNPNGTKLFLDWLENIAWKDIAGKYCMESKIRIFKCIHAEYLQVANQLRAYCRSHLKKDYYLLKSIPAVGGYLAAAILAELGDIRRFNKEEQFAAYVGINPKSIIVKIARKLLNRMLSVIKNNKPYEINHLQLI